MRRAIWVFGCLLASTASPAGASFSFIPAKVFFVKNNSAVALSCSVSADAAVWEPWFAMSAGAEWERKVQVRDPKLFIRCKPPAAAVAYPLKGGSRYSFLRDAPGAPIKLKLITTTKS